jgi:peptide/nickel transport system ATP-binding protein
MSPEKTLLAINDLSLEFRTRSGNVFALDKVSIALAPGETLGLVGESGSGKSVLSYAIMGILDAAGQVTHGDILFDGADLLKQKSKTLEAIRGKDIAMIFQNPRTALNPIRQVGRQIEDVLRRHTDTPVKDLRRRAIECLAEVRISDPKLRYNAYPFELSGGMCQRVMIAIAIACRPRLLIADEPTTGLDVTTQASIMQLISELAAKNNMATLLITHDLGLAREFCQRIAVMHAGHVVEVAPTEAIFDSPLHPYTAQLVRATPVGQTCLGDLASIPGFLPDLSRTDLPPCRFAERCERRAASCSRPLKLMAFGAERQVACHQAEVAKQVVTLSWQIGGSSQPMHRHHRVAVGAGLARDADGEN